MSRLADLLQTDDWKTEKHVPAIEVNKSGDERVEITASVGKEIAHPNTTEHHINWIELYFLPAGEKHPYQVGRYEFAAHGASTEGPDTSDVYSPPEVSTALNTSKSGTLIAKSYCNIHGLWTSEVDV